MSRVSHSAKRTLTRDSPLWTSHSRTVSSIPPEATTSPLGLHATQNTALKCPRKTRAACSGSPPSVAIEDEAEGAGVGTTEGWVDKAGSISQIRTDLSSDAEARRVESAENEMSLTPFRCEW